MSVALTFSCACCLTVFAEMTEGKQYFQSDGCATTCIVQKNTQNYTHTDGPPPANVIPPGDFFMQSFWGSEFDESVFVFDGQQTLDKVKHEWAKHDVPICDGCIKRMLSSGEIVKKADMADY